MITSIHRDDHVLVERVIIKTGIRRRGDRYPIPSDAELESWVFDSVCETPDGETVEPDHPDSWLRLLGFI